MQDFAVWLQRQLDERGWSKADFAREAKIDTGTVSNILNEVRKPGKSFFKKAAKALKLKDTILLYHAGFASDDPEDPTQRLDPIALDILALLESKSEVQKRAAREALRALFETLERGNGQGTQRDSGTAARKKQG